MRSLCDFPSTKRITPQQKKQESLKKRLVTILLILIISQRVQVEVNNCLTFLKFLSSKTFPLKSYFTTNQLFFFCYKDNHWIYWIFFQPAELIFLLNGHDKEEVLVSFFVEFLFIVLFVCFVFFWGGKEVDCFCLVFVFCFCRIMVRKRYTVKIKLIVH